MITLEMLENIVGLEHFYDSECSESDVDRQELMFFLASENLQPHANTIVNL